MAVIDEMLEANRRYARGFPHGDLALPPSRKVAVVTCMDARIDPGKALGLNEGDAHVIRNAGGRTIEALRSLAISQWTSVGSTYLRQGLLGILQPGLVAVMRMPIFQGTSAIF